MQNKNELFRHIKHDVSVYAETLFSMAMDYWIEDNIPPEDFINEVIPALKNDFMNTLRKAKEDENYFI